MTTENNQAPEVDETAQEQQEDSVANTADEAESTPSKTYTQEDVDNLIAVQKAKLPNKEEWDAFQAWKDQAKDKPAETKQQTESTDRRLSELEAKLAKAEQEASDLRNLNAVRSSGINEDFAEYVSFEVNKLVDKDKDFETALTEWIEANPQYKQPTTATGMRRGSSPASQMDGVERHFRELNPNLKLT